MSRIGGIGVLELPSGCLGNGADVELGTPPQRQGRAVGAHRTEVGLSGAVPYRGAQHGVIKPGGRGGAGSFSAVDADDRMEVHEPALLVLGDLGERQPAMPRPIADTDSKGGGEGTAKVRGEPSPQHPGVGLPQHRPDVVVGVGVQRRADTGVVAVVALSAGARAHEPARGDSARMHRAERRRGEGHERPGVCDHAVRDAFDVVAGETGAQQVERIGAVPVRACRAHRRAAIAAGGQDSPGAFDQ
jgi:hypothetical protein